MNFKFQPLKIAQVKTRRQIAHEFGIDPATLKKVLKENKVELPPGLVFPKWQRQVYNVLAPGCIEGVRQSQNR